MSCHRTWDTSQEAAASYTLFHKSIFYENIEPEICEILRLFLEETRGLEFELNTIMCVENL